MTTSTERNQERRKWLREKGHTELRGVYPPTEMHAEIKRILEQAWPTPKKRDEK